MHRAVSPAFLLIASVLFIFGPDRAVADPNNVYVSRFWHNHQPIYWPEWNNNGSETSRVQYAWDSIVLKPGQTYGGITGQHPENNLTDIFGLQDRVTSYQSGPRNSLTTFNSAGGFAISYSGSLIDNVRQLGSVGQLGYGGGWNNGYKEARGWKTPAGSTRMDLVGFTYHHALAPLLPKSVFRKELQIFKQAWWKAWGGNMDLSDHSKGFFPTEMAYSRHLIDVLVDEGYQWVIVPSHHISRTCTTYNNQANPEGTYNIYSSPPNKADQIGPSPTNGWWYSEPNPGNAAWNVAPFAYQLHKVKYVNPETGAEKTMIAVPSDDVLSYRYGYANEGVGKIDAFISPFATDPARPVIVMPSTDGDNAWGGGSSSWMEATPQLFNDSGSRGYKPSTPQDFVNLFGANAPATHIEDGAWIFPEMDYGSPNFLKWIEPPVANTAIGATNRVPGTQIDMETPGFALKFYSYAPLMAGANWCETAEQILLDEGGSVQAWKIQAPYDWNGTWNSPNEVEQAWHIYLAGLDSGFNYYGGLGNDDEIKPSLATRRAVEKLEPWINANNRRSKDRTPPTVLKPQRFPYNPGWYTFGWFNNVPGVNGAFLKRMNSDFYIWTHAYDMSGIPDGNVKLKVRSDADGINPLWSNQNETYAGGSEVGQWVTINMTKRTLPKTRQALNAAAANSQIDYFLPVQDYAVADYYFAHLTDTNYRNKLLDYYIEATDSKGNVSKSEIQHVWVDDYSGQTNGGGSGGGGVTNSVVSLSPSNPVAGQSLTVTYNPTGRVLASATNVNIHYGYNGVSANWTPLSGKAMTNSGSNWTYTYTVPVNATTIAICFNNCTNTSANSGAWDNNGGGNWNFNVTTNPITQAPDVPTGLFATATNSTTVSVSWTGSARAASYKLFRDDAPIAAPSDAVYIDTGRAPETTYAYKVVAVNAIGESAATAPVSATTPFAALAGTEILVTDPAGSPSVSNNAYTFKGRAGASFTNGLTWTNPANGTGGTIPFPGGNVANGWSWTNLVTLADGTNAVRIDGVYSTNGTATYSDSPSAYTNWSANGGAGAGFGEWYFNHIGTNAGSFLASTGTEANMNVGSSKGFGLWANGADVAKATRAFVTPMKAGDSFAVRFDNNLIEKGKSVGFELRDTNGTVRFKFYFVGGDTSYRIADLSSTNRSSGLAYSSAGLSLKLTLTGADTYSLETGSSVITGTNFPGSEIAWLEFINSGAGAGTDYNLYIGEMSHTILTGSSAAASTTATVTKISDPDSTDGLPNMWWSAYFPDQSDRVAANDPDKDGFNNAQEHALGTDPTDRASTFRITLIQREGTNAMVSWTSVPGKAYQLQSCTNLGILNWTNLAAPVTALSNSASAHHQGVADQHFYRVLLVP
ncbi:MAG: hypothetical protein FGM15_12315 [Chthoniobacterales bacterium]|nr:hypothetical protein [Chthoniobacterales bacterium]